MIKIIATLTLFTDAFIHMCAYRVMQILEAHFPENKIIRRNIRALNELIDMFEQRLGHVSASRYTAQMKEKHEARKGLISGLVHYAKWIVKTADEQAKRDAAVIVLKTINSIKPGKYWLLGYVKGSSFVNLLWDKVQEAKIQAAFTAIDALTMLERIRTASDEFEAINQEKIAEETA